ncbi:MAG: Uma2 family endonuclease [Phormidesmis sp.]
MVTTASNAKATILPLESGDRLTRHEFEIRYAAMPHLKKAELIEGVVYLTSPVRVQHGQPHSDIITWLGTYGALTPGVMVCDNTTVRLDADNEPQPDALLRIDHSKGGRSRISEDDYIEGAPELAVEIAASSASYDLHDKKRAYQRNGVQEYLVWQASSQSFIWFSLQAGEYVALSADGSGILRSQIFPGLWLDVDAFGAGNLSQVLETLKIGINCTAHQEFIRRLSSD